MKDIISEKVIEKSLNKKAKDLGGMSLKLLSTHMTGLPDRMILLPGGKMFFVEVKTTGEKPRKIQLYIHKKLRKLGFDVYVIDHLDQIEPILER